ncbi:MAG: serine hydrolase domain-containing protein [Pirellulales bacterium]
MAVIGCLPAWAAPVGEELDERLAARLEAMECPGALVGIFPDEGEPRRWALGVADVESRRPMTLDMHMRIGSVSKPLLGTVVLQLVGEGKLSLDEPISKYVPDVPAGESITLEMLGHNTSGLFNTIENKQFQRAIMDDPERNWPFDEILEFTFARPSYFSPGEKFRYSNTNAVLLARAVEQVTGHAYGEEIQRRVCRPLGLRHTGVPVDGKLPEPCPRAYRNGYPDKVIGYGDVFYDVTPYSASWTNAAGELYSTLDDLGRLARPLATGQLLEQPQRSQMHDWTDTGHAGIKYGFLIAERDDGIGHTGDVPGFNAVCLYYPQWKTSVVVLTNLSNNNDETMPAEELAKVVVEQLGREELRDEP